MERPLHRGAGRPRGEKVIGRALRIHAVPILVEPKNDGSAYVARVGDPDGHGIEVYADL